MDDFLKPSLLPKVADPLWFSVDRPCDDDVELTKLEEEHKQWVRIANALKLYRACIELAFGAGLYLFSFAIDVCDFQLNNHKM